MKAAHQEGLLIPCLLHVSCWEDTRRFPSGACCRSFTAWRAANKLERKVSVTNGNMKGEEKLQDFTEYLHPPETPCPCASKAPLAFWKLLGLSLHTAAFGVSSANSQWNYFCVKLVRVAKAQEFGWPLKRYLLGIVPFSCFHSPQC